MTNFELIIVLGPTATGKTRFAAELAAEINAEIISADSRQIYKRMNLGTGKDYQDYIIRGTKIPVYLTDIHEPGSKYNVFEYQQDFLTAYRKIKGNNKNCILCGGTGLYIEAVVQGYKLIAVPVNKVLRKELAHKSLAELEKILAGYRKLHNKTDTDTVKRAIRAIEIEEYYQSNPHVETDYPRLKPVYIGLECDREIRRQRITFRLKKRLEEGMIEEVRSLLNEGIPAQDLIYYGLEYKYITLFLTGELDYDTMFTKLNTAIHQYAKRQMTWFRRDNRINWHDIGPETDFSKLADEIIAEIKDRSNV